MMQRLIVQSIVWLAFMGAMLFVPAGTLRWPAAWTYLAIIALSSPWGGLWLARHNPGLLKERLSPFIQRGQQTWDKILVAGLGLLWCAWHVLMGLDAVRFRWSEMPLWLQFAGALLLLVGLYVAFRTMQVNSYAAPVVKIQAERGHRVVSDGPYAIVRHPMYTGALLFFIATSLLLGSWWGLATAPAIGLLLGVRAVLEERTLARALEGYADYAKRVRYRLVPFVW